MQLADSGHIQAQGFLGYVLSDGEWGIAKDLDRAERYLIRAAASGDGMTHVFLYLMNFPNAQIDADEWFIKSDDYEANLEIALKAGNAAAQYFYALQLRDEQEYAKSYDQFVKSADQGFLLSEAMQVYIEDYEHHKAARSSYRLRAYATTGMPIVITALAGMHKYGIGAPRSYEQAYELLLIANEFSEDGLGPDFDEPLRKLSKPFSGDFKKTIQMRAKKIPFVWAEGPDTYLAPAAKWCKDSGNWTKGCIVNALFDHEFCLLPYLYWEFDNPIGFPNYNMCRLDAHNSNAE